MTQTNEQILQVAKGFDDVIETRDIERILPFFAEDCNEAVLSSWIIRKIIQKIIKESIKGLE